MAATSQGEDASAFSEQLGFQLYAASRTVVGVYRRRLREFGLTYPQYLMMTAVWQEDGRTVTSLCEEVELDSGTVSPLLRRLEAEGYVLRQRTGSDGRCVRVFCTELGRGLQRRVGSVAHEVEAAVGLNERELSVLTGQLAQLREAVRGM